MAKSDSKLIEQTLAIWQPGYEEDLTLEDARALVANMTAFFDLLGEWDAADQENMKEEPKHAE